MRSAISALAVIAGLSLIGPNLAWAEPTEITVRVLSRDAKFIGSSMGGVQIILRDSETGEILARGITAGGTGNTSKIMHKDHGRRAQLADESAAKFTATLDLDAPRLIEVDAYGPLAQPQAAHRVVSSQWVVPGANLSGGDGWVLEMPGFVVDVLAPPAHVKLPAGTTSVPINANVTMMCGCPIEPGGLWDANAYTVKAVVKRNGDPWKSLDLAYAGSPSQFAGTLAVDGPGVYDILVYAHDPANGNTGLDRSTFIVPAP